MKLEKTKVERILDQKKIVYDSYTYSQDPKLTGEMIAQQVGIECLKHWLLYRIKTLIMFLWYQ